MARKARKARIYERIPVKCRPGKLLLVHNRWVTDEPRMMPNTPLVRRHLKLGRLLPAEMPAENPAPSKSSGKLSNGGND